jgi:plastocyanin
MNTTGFPSDKYGIAQSPKILSIVLLVVFVVGLSAGAVLSNGNFLSNTDSNPFKVSVDNDVGTNQFILTEIDEGDNDEEVVTEHILHDFVFEASDRGGLVTWDLGDGSTATGIETTHQFQEPGVYEVKVIESLDGEVTTTTLSVTVHLETEAEVDNMECVCAPTAKDTIIPLSNHEGTSTLEGFVRVEHDGSSESCSLRNPLQECHVRVILQRLSGGDIVEESVLFDETFRSNEKVVDFNLESVELNEGDRLQLRLETDQIRDWHKPTAEWLTSAPIEG